MKNENETASTTETAQQENATTKATRKRLLVVTRPLTGKLERGYSLAFEFDGARVSLGESQLTEYAQGATGADYDKRTARGLSLLECLAVGAGIVEKNAETVRAGYLVKHFGGVAGYTIKSRVSLKKQLTEINKPIADARRKLAAAVLLGCDKITLDALTDDIKKADERAKTERAPIFDKLAKMERDERALAAFVALNHHLLTDATDEENEKENARTRAEMNKRTRGALEEINRRRAALKDAERKERETAGAATAEKKKHQRKVARDIHARRNG